MPSNKYLNFSKSPFLKKLIAYPAIGLFVHWVFQSLLYMDRTEMFFKLSLDGLFFLVFFFPVSYVLPVPYSWIISFLLAHTVNFIFNSHIWVLLKHYKLVYNSETRFLKYAERLYIRLSSQSCIVYAAIFGSSVREEWSPYSDLDIRVVRGKGVLTGIRACSYILSERTRAFINKFPLDIYLLDSFSPLARMRVDEKPKVIVNRVSPIRVD
jgi:predicted nucleotidyltransferase